VAGTDAQQTYVMNQMFGFVVGLAGGVSLALIDSRPWWRLPAACLRFRPRDAPRRAGDGAAAGAQRWVDIGPVQVQPSKFAKPGLVVVLAGNVAEKPIGEHIVFLKALCILSVPALLVFLQPGLGTTLVFGAVFVAIAYVAGAMLVRLVGLVAAPVLVVKAKFLEEYQVARLTSFTDPGCSNDIRYQVCPSKMAIGPRGLTGKGPMPTRSLICVSCRKTTRTLLSQIWPRGWASWGASCSSAVLLLDLADTPRRDHSPGSLRSAHCLRCGDDLFVSRVRQRRYDDGNNAGDRNTATFYQLWAEQPGGQRPLS
jgi:FtsW/RodA/SpoVE-like cell cycle protein